MISTHQLCDCWRSSKDAGQARRLLALAAIYEGAKRHEATKIGGVTLQIVRDWVVKFNARGAAGLIDGKASGQSSLLDAAQRAALAAAVVVIDPKRDRHDGLARVKSSLRLVGVDCTEVNSVRRIVRILFVHQNAPGQFRHLAPYLADDVENSVVFLSEGARSNGGAVRWLAYATPTPTGAQTHRYLRRAELSVRRGQAVARACLALQQEGFEPDLIIGHPGWGETMFLRDILPRTPILSYCELFYRSEGQDTDYIPETRIDLDGRCRIRTWNADLLTALSTMDRGLSPTRWQRDQHPSVFRDRIAVIHDGVDTSEVAPHPNARFKVPNGPSFAVGDEVVTFVARDLEPVRGFVMLMQALPELLRRRPGAHIVICGGDGVSYGRPAPGGRTWRETMSSAVSLDPTRVHFVGKLARPEYLNLLRVSALHLYLSVPFVLSWSCIEALASGCLLLGSDVAPVREVVEDGVNGFLVDARDGALLARRAADLLARRALLVDVRSTARQRVIAEFELERCLAQQTRLLQELVP